MPINDGFVTAVSPKGQKRRVPLHYLENKALGYKLPPKARASQQRAPREPEDKKRTNTTGSQAETEKEKK